MALPRSSYVQEGQEGVYHCFSRCVRRAFLYGVDRFTGQDFSHRRAWIFERLRFLAAIFAIDVCAYAVMENHYHTILRTRPDLVSGWSERDVASRWLALCPRRRNRRNTPTPSLEQQIIALADCPDRIAKLRLRLSSLSWFMGRLNEFIARAANKEDNVKGRFWEARFKCQALLDGAATVSGMVYVDLNAIRAGLADTPEHSDFTSIQERMRAWQRLSLRHPAHPIHSSSSDRAVPESALESSDPSLQSISALSHPSDTSALSDCFLCPITSDSRRRGILQITTAEYFELVDLSGRMIRSDKPGAIDPHLAPILSRIGAKPDAWFDTVSQFGSSFSLAAGLLPSLRKFADQIGRRWLKGLAAARVAFA